MNKIEYACENLGKSFSNKLIFKKLCFKLINSSSLAITGRNGTGKSTLIKILSNLIKETNGKKWMKLNGEFVEKDNQFSNIGLLAPYINLYEELTGYENLEFFYKLKINQHRKKEVEENINHLLKKVNLYKRRNDWVKNYSSGMKQRLKIAFAILNDPPILLMDEPRTNLDEDGIKIIYNIADEQKKNGILIIATNENEDTRLCDEILNIEDYRNP